jgi:hypothetical protein
MHHTTNQKGSIIMPTRLALVEMVANQMLKGPKGGSLPGTAEQREEFRQQHEKKIEWVVNQLPRCSAAVGAVLTKAALRYGDEPIQKFCLSLRTQSFTGPDDPSYHLWKYLMEGGQQTKITYRKALYAVKAYIDGKKITSIRQGKGDILKWDGEKLVE